MTSRGKYSPEAREETLRRHIEATQPHTSVDFAAKEHFWQIGDEVDVSRRTTSFVFLELCFPVVRGSKKRPRRRFQPVNTEELGLVIKPRHEVGLPDLPPHVLMGRGSVSDRALAHLDDWDAAADAPNRLAIQIAGVASLDLDSEIVDLTLTPNVQKALAALVPRFQEFPAAPEPGV